MSQSKQGKSFGFKFHPSQFTIIKKNPGTWGIQNRTQKKKQQIILGHP